MQQQLTEKPQFTLDTDAFATRNGVKGQTVRARICRFGHYFGIRPKKLANGRLIFPDVQVVA
ncbi:MAG TPA: hypothetical protein VMV91_14815 [Rhodocyclaceae bacterium]|nr:hypothetical protein [Rhodocyclaceae bacterium]